MASHRECRVAGPDRDPDDDDELGHRADMAQTAPLVCPACAVGEAEEMSQAVVWHSGRSITFCHRAQSACRRWLSARADPANGQQRGDNPCWIPMVRDDQPLRAASPRYLSLAGRRRDSDTCSRTCGVAHSGYRHGHDRYPTDAVGFDTASRLSNLPLVRLDGRLP